MVSTRTSSRLDNLLKSLKKPVVEPEPVPEPKVPEPQHDDDVEEVKLQEIPRGRPKSGKIWKTKKEKFSSIKKTKGSHKTFAEKEALRATLKRMKETSRALQEEVKATKEMKKERRRINIKKTEENRLKSEIVQVISNSAKVKRMKKKQLRFIEKRDTTKVTSK